MKLSLYDLLQVSSSDHDSPNILLTVHLSDLHQLVVDTIEATRERLLPIFMEAEKDKPLTKKQAAEQLGVCETTVWNMVRDGKLHPFKVNGSTRYSQREIREIINARNEDTTPVADDRFERIGTTYYKIVRQPNAAGQLIERSIPWTIEAIRRILFVNIREFT